MIVGPPNAGKSSLLNALAGSDRAIVTDIAGTTRDLLRETVRIDGVELTLVDTAGLRDGGDAIEREGMRRAHAELERAELAIVVLDARAPGDGRRAVEEAIAGVPQRLWLHNKADLLDAAAAATDDDALRVSAHTGAGLAALHARLRALALGAAGEGGEGAFTARARHVDALRRAAAQLADARQALRARSARSRRGGPARRPRGARRDHRPRAARRSARTYLLDLLHRQIGFQASAVSFQKRLRFGRQIPHASRCLGKNGQVWTRCVQSG